MNDGLYESAGDIPPTGGFREPERRRTPRREEDKLSADMQEWVAEFITKKGLWAIIIAVCSALVTAFGLRIVGPSQDIKALDQKFTAKDSAMSIRVSRIEDRQAQVLKSLQEMAVSIQFLTYLQCRQMPRDDRPATCYVRGTEP